MRNLNLKPFLFILLLCSALIWFAVAAATGLNLHSFLDFLRPIPSVVSADLVLVGVFVKWLWRWRPLQGWLVPFPDLNGTWQGHIQTTWKDSKDNTPSPIPTILTIKQTFLRTSCVMRTAEMESHSYVEGFCIDDDAQIRRLCYCYTSKPRSALRDRSTPHDGTMLFNIVGNPVRKLEGEYWTQRHTTGTVTLTFRTEQLLDELPADIAAHPMMPVGS